MVAFIIVFEDETELHAFYEKGITYLSQSFSRRQLEDGKKEILFFYLS